MAERLTPIGREVEFWANHYPQDEPPEQRAARRRTQAEDQALEARAVAEHVTAKARPKLQPLTAKEVLDHMRERAKDDKARHNSGLLELVDEVDHWRDGPPANQPTHESRQP